MTKYIDKYNGVWELVKDFLNDSWVLRAGNTYHFDNGGGKKKYTGCYYPASVVKEYAPLVSIEDGTEYKFPVAFEPGDDVTIPQNAIGYISLKPSKVDHLDVVAAEYVDESLDEGCVDIRIIVSVPVEFVKHYAGK